MLEMLGDGRWRDPGEQALDRVMPWADEPCKFLMLTIDQMRKETGDLDRATEEEELARIFHVARGSTHARSVELPWLDLDLAFLIGGAHYTDTFSIALDYRTGVEDPQVVADGGGEGADLHQGDRWPLGWRVVTPTFSAFVAALTLTVPPG
ncbi:hypothetical protein [Actinomadura sp. GTD37]|uniref:hypothetical protein n=1 Tax=Actinomadura sp. GTD37 TaxID=1778030 RepID=UPI0035C25574